MKKSIVRGTSLMVLAALIAPTPIAPAIAIAAPTDRVVDGAPTPELCAQFGFRTAQPMARGPVPTYAPLSPPPAPPPQPPAILSAPQISAAPAAPLDEVVVTGSHRRESRPPPPAADKRITPYPAQNTERYPNAVANPVKQAAQEPVSTFSIDVDTAAYANVRRFLSEGQRPPAEAVRVEELVNYFDYDYPAPASKDPPFATHIAVAPAPWSDGRQLIHIGVQGYRPAPSEQPPLNLVFLVDTSGSMAPADRLPLAQKALNVLVDQLRPQDRVSLVAYAGSAGAVLSPTGGAQKLKIRCAIDYLESGGSTAGGAGLALAYGLARQHFDPKAVNRVVLMTDGDFNVGVTDNKRLEDFVADKRKSGVYLSVYGFGRGNYQDERMQVLAQNGNGTAAYVDTFDEARKLFRDDVSKSLFPIADDVKIQVEFNPARVAEYRLIGYETRLLKREDFNNDAVDAGEVSAGASVTALYEITPVGGRSWSDPLRYGTERGASAPKSGELAYLKIRYKAPGGTASRLIERPIGVQNTYAAIERAPEATRWAVAVAAYGQKLRNDPYVQPGFSWDQVERLAQGARGEDPMGVRAEFVRLTHAAKEIQGRTEVGALGR